MGPSRKSAAVDPKLKVLVVDDEPLARRFLHRLLLRDREIGEIRHGENGIEARSEIRQFQPDIVFLDVQMPGLTGVDLLAELPGGRVPAVVFTTAYSEHAIKAFDLDACDYLLKPFDERRFERALARAKASVRTARRNSTAGKLAVQRDERTILLEPGEIDFVSSEDNYVTIRSGGRFYLRRTTLEAMEQLLCRSGFVRVHRRFLVNLDRVKEVVERPHRRLQLILADGFEVPASRGYKRALKAFIRNG